MDKLNLIKEIPHFEQEAYTNTADAFDHESFAQTLFRVINDNEPPLTIGLFGSWGIGKSSIINILKHKLNDKKKYAFVYFNAWQYSSDSFRRQFLLTVANADGILKTDLQKEKIARLQRLNHSDIVQKRKEKISLSKSGLLRLVIFLVIACGGVYLLTNGGYTKSWGQIGAGIFALVVSIVGLLLQHLGQVIQVNIDNVIDPKLIFPEQFANEFDLLIAHALKNESSKKIIFVVDDIDRCDVETIKDILVSMKTFLSHPNCYFVVPMDDASVVQIFKEKNENFGYEQLRKYFGVSIRIPVLNQEDIIAFAKSISQQYAIPIRVTYVAALGNCRDARKMKHFLNSYKLKIALAEQRKNKGFLGNTSLASIEMQIAKLIVLEYQYPELFRSILYNSELLSNLIDVAREKIQGTDALAVCKKINSKVSDVNEYWNQNTGLKEFLLGTYTIKLEDIELLTKFKITNQELALTDLGVQIRDHLILGKSLHLDEESLRQSLKENIDLVVDILMKYLTADIPPVCIRAINFSITLFNFIEQNKKDLLLDKVCGVITNYSVGYNLDENALISLLDNYDIISNQYKDEIVSKIHEEFFKPGIYYKDFATIINHSSFKKIATLHKDFSTKCCTAIEEWYTRIDRDDKKILLNKYNEINFTQDERGNIPFSFPSKDLLIKIIKDVSVKDDYQDNSSIYDLIIAEKNQVNLSKVKSELNNKIFQIISENINDYNYNAFLQLGFETIRNLNPVFIIQDTLQKIEPLLEAHIPSFNTEKKPLILVDQFLVHKMLDEGTTKTSTKSSLDNFVSVLAPAPFNEFIQLMELNLGEDKETHEFIKECLKNATQKCIDNYERPNAQITELAQIIRKNKSSVVDTYFDFVFKLFTISNTDALSSWLPLMKESFLDFETDKRNSISDRVFENFKNTSFNNQVRKQYGDLLVELLESNHSFYDKRYFSDIINFIDDDNEFPRQYGNEKFDALLSLFGDEIPKARVSSLLDSIISKSDLTIFNDSIHTCLKFKTHIDSSVWEKIASRIITDIFKDDINADKKIYLLNLGFHIEGRIDNAYSLSRVLFNYMSNPSNEEVKAKSEELYSNLISRNIISAYEPQQ